MISSRPSIRFPRRRFLLAIVVIVVLMWCGLLTRSVLAVKAGLDRLQADLDAAGRNDMDLESIGNQVSTLRDEVLSLRTLGAPLLAVAPAFGWLPGIGNDVAAAPALAAVVVDLLDAAKLTLDTAGPLWHSLRAERPATSGEPSAPEAMLSRLSDVSRRISPAREAVGRALDKLSTVDSQRLSPDLSRQVERLSTVLPLLDAGFDLLDQAPDLMGLNRPKTYIVLIQNDDELRPTGGFISAVARITLDKGAMVDLDVRDSYQVDDYRHKPYGFPPQPLFDYMGSELWLFRDANWSPDFPTSARKAAELYAYGLGVAVDGVIGVNQKAVREIVDALGPILVEPGQPPVDADNLIAYMREAWSPPPDATDVTAWIVRRKDFIGKLTTALLNRVQSAPDQIKWIDLGRAVLQQLNSHNLLIWLRDQPVSDVLSRHAWDGAVQSVPGDYWMVVDSNVGFNKANVLIRTSAVYSVTLQPDLSAVAELTVRYQHTGTAAAGCTHLPEYSLDLSYDDLMQSCYYDYVRLLVPGGARLVAATRRPVPAEYLVTAAATDGAMAMSNGFGKTVWSTLFVVERGQSLDMRMSYVLPDSVVVREGDRWTYRLYVQKQPGGSLSPLRVIVNWPAGLMLEKTRPAPRAVSDQSVTLDLAQDTDQQVEIHLLARP